MICGDGIGRCALVFQTREVGAKPAPRSNFMMVKYGKNKDLSGWPHR